VNAPADALSPSLPCLGAILGDIAGSAYEFDNCRRTDIDLFPPSADVTDDSILTLAVARWLLDGPGDDPAPLALLLHRFGNQYPFGGYGGRFAHWLSAPSPAPYNSLGNGSAMRASPCGFAARSLDEALDLARRSALPTHDHPEGVKGAQAVAAAIYLARTGASKADIRSYVASTFAYDLDRTCDDIRPDYRFDETCPGSVPEAIVAFLDSADFESCIRLAISIGGDSDTIACMAGGIAQAFYREIPPALADPALQILARHPPLLDILNAFAQRFPA